MWDLPRSGIEDVCPALAGRFLTTESPESSVQFSRSVVSDLVTPWTAARKASLSITNSRSSHKLISIESVMPSNHLLLCRPFLFPPSIFPSIRVFSKESALSIRWPKYWSFSFSVSPSSELLGLISCRMDWLEFLVGNIRFSSVQFSLSVMSASLRPHESQHTRLPCPSPTPGVHPNSCPSSR